VSVVDAHTHLGLERFIVRPISEEKKKRPAFRDGMENRPGRLLAAMDRNGVQQAVVFPYPLAEVDSGEANRYVLEAARLHSDRLIPFVLLDGEPAAWIARGARGFKQHFLLEPERFPLDRVYPPIAEAGLPLLAHLTTRAIVPGARAILKLAPRLPLIIAHLGRCEPNTALCVEENLLALAGLGNVFFETSTVRDPAAFRRAVELVGAERLCFGSDFPFNSYLDTDPLAVELAAVRAAGLPAGELEQVLGGTIRRLLQGGIR